MQCVVCDTELATPLETFGDLDAPMCQSCHLGLLGDMADDPLYQALFSYEPVGNGWYAKKLTEAGALFLEGTVGETVMLVNRGGSQTGSQIDSRIRT